jgi:large repetitive protein
MKNSLKLLLLVIVQAISFFGFSQKGKHADYTVTGLDQIVNTYTSLTANAAAGQTSIMVASNSMNGGVFAGALEQGDLILIIQMQGANMDIDVTPTASWGGAYTIPFGVSGDWHYAQDQWGRVLNYNNAGKFEKAEVKSLIGANSIELSCPLQHAYTASGHVQIVRIPRFNNLTVNTASSITAPAWDGTTGGIVAVEVDKDLTLNGSAEINTVGKGFRGAVADNIGGSLDSNPSAFTGGIGSTFLASYLGVNGARKGEGIGGFTTEYAALYSEYSRSAPANGGGGGGIQNAGGGGGANVGVGTYTGKGVPSTTYPNSVWDLELAGFGGSTSSGGGRGGYALSSSDRNELTVGPNTASWGGAARKVEGGLGGHALDYDATRLFFGGGGGAGDQDNGQAGAGGNGGGIAFLTVYGNILGDGSILANGADGGKSNPLNQTPPNNSTQKKGNDGAGGAGGGGSVYIENINPIAGTIKLKAIGGKGGNQDLVLSNFAVSEAGGPGGGGAGGLVCLGAGGPSVDVSGGLNGITTSSHMINFKANGATNGAQGFAININNFFDLVAVPDTICSGQQGFPSVNVIGTLPGGALVYWYDVPTGGTALSAGNMYGTPPLTVTTTYYASVCPGTFRVPVEVVVLPIPVTPTITTDGPTTFCTGGSVTLTSSSTINNVWSTGETTQAITVTASGDYSVTVGTAGCTATSTITTVTVNSAATTPTITAGGPTTFCTGGSVTLTSSSATDNLWSTTETTQSITVSTSGDYTVTVGTAGCTATSTITTVVVNPMPTTPTITAGGPTTFCSGGSVTLTSSSATDNLWSTGEVTQSITVSTSGDYTVTVGTAGCTATSTITTVVVNPLPATPTITAGGPTTFCSGGSVTLTSSSASDNLWSTGESTQSITVSTSGDYTVTVGTAGCTSTSAITTVTANPSPATPTITAGGPTTFCSGGSVTLSSSSATDNLWSTGESTQSITVSTSGDYTVTVGTGGCTSTSTITTVSVNSNPATPTVTAGGPTTFCAGDNVTLTSSAASGNTWSNGETTQSIIVTASGDYSVTVGASGCSASSTITTVVVNPSPATPTITAGGPTTFCSGGSVTLTSSSATDNLWSTGEVTQSITVTTSGDYTVTVGIGGCTSTSTITTVSVNSNPATPTVTAGGPTTFCAGDNVTLTSSAASGNTWSNGETTQSIIVTASGDYSVTVGASGCSASSTITTVVVNPSPATPTITAGGPTTFCSGGSVTLSSSSATDNLWSTGETTQAITVTASGDYTVTVGSGVCTATSTITTVTVNPTPVTPTITANGPTTFCSGGSVTLSSSSATDNLWSTGEVTQSITVTSSGDYTVTVGSGVCTSTSTITTVSVNSNPTTPIITASGSTTFCTGDNVVLTSSAGSGNTWSTGETTQAITVTSSGDYSVTVGASGCSATSTITTVTVNPAVSNPIISANGPTTFCEGGSVVLTSSELTGNTWSTGETTQSISVSTAGDVVLTYTENGCSATSNQLIEVNPNPIVTPTSNGPICEDEDLNLDVNVTAGASYSWTGPSTNSTASSYTINNATVSDSGTYSIEVNLNGCIVTETIEVVVNQAPNTQLTSNGPLCEGDDLNLGLLPCQWDLATWSGPNNFVSNLASVTINDIDESGEGDYVLDLSLNGCSASFSIYVEVNPLPVFTISANTPICEGEDLLIEGVTTLGNFGPTTQFSWSGPQSFNSTVVSNTLTDVTKDQEGLYDLTVTENGCSKTQSLLVVIKEAPMLSNQGPIIVCEGEDVNLLADNNAGANYLWSGPNDYMALEQNPTLVNVNQSISGLYTVRVEMNGCVDSIDVDVQVNGLPSVGVTMNGGNCEGDDLLLFSNGNGNSTYSWTGPNNFSSTEQNPVLSPVGPLNSGTYVVNVDENGCKSSSQIYVNVNAKPTVDFRVDEVSGCSPLLVVFTNQSFPADAAVVWDFGNGSNSTSAITDSTVYTSVGCYDVSLTVTSNGCSETLTQSQMICVTDSPIAEFTVNQNSASIQNPVFEFLNNSSFADSYMWDFGDNTIQNTTNANHLYESEAGSYQVQLVASNDDGCTDTAYATVQITDELIFYVPNAFTPNGDAYNNRFEPVFYSGYDPSSYTLYIFNRWGEIIFESHDVNQGWDGTFQDRMMQDDVYQWLILFEDSVTDERYRFDGHVSLVK